MGYDLKTIAMMSSLLPGEWSFGEILIGIFVLNVVVFLVLTFAPKVHNTITCAIKKFIDFVSPHTGTKKAC